MSHEDLHQLRFDTGPELVMGAALKKAGIDGWRTQFEVEGVMPTFVWPKKRIALFADDCNRHGCPEHRKEPWKAGRDAARDDLQSRKLIEAGWKVFFTFECEISSPEKALGVAKFIRSSAMRG